MLHLDILQVCNKFFKSPSSCRSQTLVWVLWNPAWDKCRACWWCTASSSEGLLLITFWHTSEPCGLVKNFQCPLQLLRGNFTNKITFSFATLHTCIHGIYKDTSLLIHQEASLPAARKRRKIIGPWNTQVLDLSVHLSVTSGLQDDEWQRKRETRCSAEGGSLSSSHSSTLIHFLWYCEN